MKEEAVWFGNKVVDLRLFNLSGDQAMQTAHLPSAEARTDLCARALVMRWCSYIYMVQLSQSPMLHPKLFKKSTPDCYYFLRVRMGTELRYTN